MSNYDDLAKVKVNEKRRYLWKAKILPDRLVEWKYRHENLWPEMRKALEDAGIRNYSIWTDGDDLIGYYECDDVDFTARSQAESAVVDMWNQHVKDVVDMQMDPVTGAQPKLTEVWVFNDTLG